MNGEETRSYNSPLAQFLDDERRKKIKRFYSLLAEGKEFHYDWLQDVLYADLNLTLTSSHLAMKMLEYLDQQVFEKAKEIMSQTERSKRSRVLSIAKLVEGKTIIELQQASEKAAQEVNLADYIIGDLKNLQPTKLKIWSDTPKVTVDIYKELKLNPIYNSESNKHVSITVYATELVQKGGILTGEVSYIPDELERNKIQGLEHLTFLKQNIGLIV